MGKFITFEGTEGVGKSTQIKLLESFLKQNGIKTLLTREPGGTKVGEQVRDILLDNEISRLDSYSELLLMFAARSQHLKEIIHPALNNDVWVLCDRFTDASYAYQGGGRGIEKFKIQNLEEIVQNGFKPDLTILLAGNIEIGMQRVSDRGDKDRFEREQLDFYRRVQNTYVELANAETDRFAQINADQSIDDVQAQIEVVVKKKFTEYF